jgi:hypothetical protein
MTAIRPPRQRTLSKSDFTLARTCEAKLYFREARYPDNREFDPYLVMLAQGGYMVEALAKARYADGIQLEYGSDFEGDAALTLEYLQRDNVTLFEGTLHSARRLARADIIVKQGDTIRLIEVKAKSFDSQEHLASLADGNKGVFVTRRGISAKWDKYLADITYQTLLLERMLPGVTVEPFLCLVDKSKRSDVNDIPELFKVERKRDRHGVERIHTARFTGDVALLPELDLVTEVPVGYVVDMMRDGVEAEAARFEQLLDSPREEFTATIGHVCRECEFRIADLERNGFRECWGELADASPHMLELFSIGTLKADGGVSMAESLASLGKSSLFDIPEERLVRKDGTVGPVATRQRRQIACARTGEFWISDQLQDVLREVQYPAHYVDFEVSRLALPYHAGMRPYGQVAFQWSSHSVAAPGAVPRHGEWLNTEHSWPNERFVRSLRAEIGDEGSVLTWSRFEEFTLNEAIRDLAQFGLMDKELAEWVADVVGRRMVDMCVWAREHFHHPGMGGRTSIKAVLDSLWKSDAQMRTQFEGWTSLTASAEEDPYAALPAIEINGIVQDVREGTGAIRAYEAMMYGVEKTDEKAKAEWGRLLRQYCQLDSLSMVLIFEHLGRRRALRS